MKDVVIPKDFREKDPKVIGFFTLRQILLVIPSVAFVIFSSGALNKVVWGICIVVLAILVLSFGWLQPYNMTLEKFLTTSFVKVFLSPKRRVYKTRNHHRVGFEELSKDNSNKEKKKKRLGRKKNVKKQQEN